MSALHIIRYIRLIYFYLQFSVLLINYRVSFILKMSRKTKEICNLMPYAIMVLYLFIRISNIVVLWFLWLDTLLYRRLYSPTRHRRVFILYTRTLWTVGEMESYILLMEWFNCVEYLI